MLATWKLKSTDEGTEVQYFNLRDMVSMNCGVTDLDEIDLVMFMLVEGGGGNEVVFWNGEFVGHLMPPQQELIERRYTGGIGLQG